MRALRERISFEDSVAQLSHEVKSSTVEVRQKLLSELHTSEGTFHVTIPVSASLAMKADLNIPWNKLRIMRRLELPTTAYFNIFFNRWMKMWGVSIATENKMRGEAAALVGDNVHAELVPFSFTHKDGGEEIKQAAMAYIQDLLDQNNHSNKGYFMHCEVLP